MQKNKTTPGAKEFSVEISTYPNSGTQLYPSQVICKVIIKQI
ncbi:hypothetical protein WGH24286_00452 [Periweissella ghanensis]|uniref:Uncharacterized protein n=1 Tax=Periweissella ghanensis TaxID=467997 RepID=A0ABM8Z9Y8_9LACO|nr:hypothetical protein WGH24286_00452 [Periweissella ghanensis]